MRRRPPAEAPRITSRSKLRSPSFNTSSVHQIPLPSVLPQYEIRYRLQRLEWLKREAEALDMQLLFSLIANAACSRREAACKAMICLRLGGCIVHAFSDPQAGLVVGN